MTRYRLDPATRLIDHHDPSGTSVLLGGSPLRLFRVTSAGRQRVVSIIAGDDVTTTPLVERLVDAGVVHPLPDASTDRAAYTTAVIVTHDGDARQLSSLVDACRAAAVARVIVVDDGSEPPIDAAACARADVIRHDANRGPGAARNTGLGATTTEFVVFLDDDIVIGHDATRDDGRQPSRWLRQLLGHFDDTQLAAAAPRVASRRPPTIDETGVPAPFGTTAGATRLERYESDHSPLDLGTAPAVVRPGARVSYVPSAALAVRRRALTEIGGFDTTLRYGEDVDAIWRLVEHGWRCRYEPDVVVEHEPRRSWAAWARQRFHYGTSAAPLARRHPGAVTPVRMNGWTVAVWTLVAMRRPATAVALAAWTAVALDRRVPGLGRRQAARLAVLGHAQSGRLLAAAVRRVWWPIAAVAATRSRTARLIAAAACVALFFDRPTKLGDAGLRVVDDMCYGAGVWTGMLRSGDAGPLIPEVTPWPGPAGASEYGLRT